MHVGARVSCVRECARVSGSAMCVRMDVGALLCFGCVRVCVCVAWCVCENVCEFVLHMRARILALRLLSFRVKLHGDDAVGEPHTCPQNRKTSLHKE